MWFQYCQTASSAPARGSRSAEATHQVAGVIGISPCAEPEDDLTLLPVGQLKGDLDSGAGVQSGPYLAGKPRPGHRSRTPKRAVAAKELGPVAAYGPGRIIHIEEGSPVGELRVVWVPRKERAAIGVNFGDHMHRSISAADLPAPIPRSRWRRAGGIGLTRFALSSTVNLTDASMAT